MNTTQNVSYTSEWNGLNTTIRPFLTFAVIAGLIGNSLVLVMFCRLKRLKTWDNAFTINLAVGDLTSSVAAIALVFSPEFFMARVISCHSIGAMQVCRIANFLCLQEIALLRYWRVLRPADIINKSVFITGLVIPWVVGIAFRIIVWNHIKDYHSVSHCLENTLELGYTESRSRLLMVPLLSAVGTGVTTTCYMKIFLYLRCRCRSHVQTIATVQLGTSTESNCGRQFVQRMQEFYRSQINADKQDLVNSLLVLGVFYMAHIPNVVLFMGYRSGLIRNISPTVECILLLTTLSCAVNPVLYSMRSTYFRQGLKRLFHIKSNTVDTVMR